MAKHWRVLIFTVWATAALASGLLAQSVTIPLPIPKALDYGNPFAGPIVSPRPLEDMSQWMQRKFGKVITYEEVIPRYKPGLTQFGLDKTRKWTLFRAPVRLDVSSILAGANAQNLPDVLTQAVAAANAQIPTQHFILKSSDVGFHIIMDQDRDQTGSLVQVQPYLDATITIPAVERSVDDTFTELGTAISEATGIQMDASNGLGWGAFSGLEPPDLSWGVQYVSARDALISLLRQSATTFSWALLCQASAQASDEGCALNIGSVLVMVTTSSGQTVLRPLLYDRCKRCPKLPPPPPEPPPSQ